MDWERVLIDFGVIVGFLALISFWLGVAMWMRVDADKRGLVGWVWIFVGLLTGPLGLIAYVVYRGNRPVLEVVHQRDELIAQNAREHAAIDYDPDHSESVKVALAAEERRYQSE